MATTEQPANSSAGKPASTMAREAPSEAVSSTASESASATPTEKTFVKPGRIVSLDVFRGMTIAGMILVNNPGGPAYGPLDHAEWNGWTHTDLIFPFFMFIAGASMALSMSRRRDSNQLSVVSSQLNQSQRQTQDPSAKSRPQDDKSLLSGENSSPRRLVWHVVRRGATIFFIGLWLNLFPWFFDPNRYANLRIPGVLQRIGFCYIFAGIIYLWTSASSRLSAVSSQNGSDQLSVVSSQVDQSQEQTQGPSSAKRGLPQDDNSNLSGTSNLNDPSAQDATRGWSSRYLRAAIVVVLLLGYWAAMKLIPVPGYGAGDLAPTHNLGAYIDNIIFGTKHMWQHRPWDPEGLLSSIPALCTMLLGTFVGELFSSHLSVVNSQENPVAPAGAVESKSNARSLDSELTPPQQAKSGLVGDTLSARDDRAGDPNNTWQLRVKWLVVVGVLFMAAGEVWNVWFPINKNLWTSSYVMFTAGYAMVALAVVYWLVDVRGRSASSQMSRLIRLMATPFLVLGSNAILAFTLSTFVTKLLLVMRVPNGKGGSMSMWSWVIANSWRPHFAEPRNGSLAFALSYVLVWMAVMWWFYRKRIFVKI